MEQIPQDGNCLFTCLSIAVYGDRDRHLKLRRDVCNYVEQHSAEFAPKLEVKDGVDQNVEFQSLLKKSREPGVWDNNLFDHIPFACALFLGRTIHVYDVKGMKHGGGNLGSGKPASPIKLLRHQTSPQHFDLLRSLPPVVETIVDNEDESGTQQPPSESTVKDEEESGGERKPAAGTTVKDEKPVVSAEVVSAEETEYHPQGQDALAHV